MSTICLLNGLVKVNKEVKSGHYNVANDKVVCDMSHFQSLEVSSNSLGKLWDERLRTLQQIVELLIDKVEIEIIEQCIVSSIQDFSTRVENKEPFGFYAFEVNAQCGEFNFGSNCYGSFDVKTNEVEFDSHGLEKLLFKSLRDFYNCYILEECTTYQYACLLAQWGDNDELEDYDQSHEEILKRLLPKRVDEETGIWSDFVEVCAPGAAYSSRITPIHFKGEVLDEG